MVWIKLWHRWHGWGGSIKSWQELKKRHGSKFLHRSNNWYRLKKKYGKNVLLFNYAILSCYLLFCLNVADLCMMHYYDACSPFSFFVIVVILFLREIQNNKNNQKEDGEGGEK